MGRHCTFGIGLVVALVGFSSRAHGEQRGFTSAFLGWNPDSTDFAYVFTRLRDGMESTFLKAVNDSGRAVAKPCKGGVRRRAKELQYVIEEVRGQRLSSVVQAFAIAAGKTLRVVVELSGDRLWYSVWLDDVNRPGEPSRLSKGYFDELWTGVNARVFPAPNRQWAVVVLELTTPYRVESWVEGVRLRGLERGGKIP